MKGLSTTQKIILETTCRMLESRDWKVGVNDKEWNEDIVKKCFDLAKELTKQTEEFLK